GAALLKPSIGEAIEGRLGVAGRAADALGERLPNAGLAGQAAAGVVLAFAWAPCAGPVLGAALLLAAKGGSVAAAMATMWAYALGAAGALIAVGFAVAASPRRRASPGPARAAGSRSARRSRSSAWR